MKTPNSEFYLYSNEGTFIARAKTLYQAIKAGKGYAESFIVDVADHFIFGNKESYNNSIMAR